MGSGELNFGSFPHLIASLFAVAMIFWALSGMLVAPLASPVPWPLSPDPSHPPSPPDPDLDLNPAPSWLEMASLGAQSLLSFIFL